jgi:hypothetical protein
VTTRATRRDAHRVANLRGALAVVLVKADAPELRLVHQWLDSLAGIGLIVTGMSHQGFTVSLGEHGVGRWIAAFFHGHGGHEPIAAAGTGQEPTPCGRCSRRRGRR